MANSYSTKYNKPRVAGRAKDTNIVSHDHIDTYILYYLSSNYYLIYYSLNLNK